MSMNVNPNLVKLTFPQSTVGVSKTEVVEELTLQGEIVDKEDLSVDPDVILNQMATNATNNGVNSITLNATYVDKLMDTLKEAFKNGEILEEEFVENIAQMGAENIVVVKEGKSIVAKFTWNGTEHSVVGKELEKAVGDHVEYRLHPETKFETYYNNAGKKVLEKVFDDEGLLMYEYYYNEKGELNRKIEYLEEENGYSWIYPEGWYAETIYVDRENGVRAEIRVLKDDEGNVSESRTKEYDAQKRLISDVLVKGVVQEHTHFAYDTSGNLIRKTYTLYENDKNGMPIEKDKYTNEYKYNANGVLIEEKYTSDNFIYIYNYDDKGNKTKFYSWTENDNSTIEESYEYDSSGRMIKGTKKDYDPITGITTETLTDRSKDGSKTVTIKVTDASGKVISDVIETYNSDGKLVSRVDNTPLIKLSLDEFDSYGDGSFVEAGAYTKNSYAGENNVRTNAINNVRNFIDELYSGMDSNKYDSAALNYAKNMTTEFFTKVISAMSAHSGVSNGEWTGKTGIIRLSDGTTFNSVSYNQESHQGYINAKKNSYDGDNIQWTRGTMAGARFAKITIKADYIIDMFIQFYNSYAAKN